MVFSFSRLTIQHLKLTGQQYCDWELFFDPKNIKTIDSFCYDMLERLNRSDNKDGDSSDAE